jgi:acetyl-CoA C-acetyltransferase
MASRSRTSPPTELGRDRRGEALERAGIQPEQVDHVVFGNVIHTAPEDMYMARVVGMKAGIPKETPAFTVNRLCGTGVQAIVSATQAIQSGDVGVALAGGAESMSRGPYWMPTARWGSKMGEADMVDPVMGGLTDPFDSDPDGRHGREPRRAFDISREEQDAFAVESHARAARRRRPGRFDGEIVPVPVRVKRETCRLRQGRAHPPRRVAESMAKLPTVFKRDGGTVTAGNASGMNDAGGGARADGCRPRRRARRAGARADRLLRLVRGRPEDHGHRPGSGDAQGARPRRRELDQIGVIELNEAFAAQALAVMKDLDLDPAKVNPNGGAIALGHPIGATGAAITAKCLAEMEREGHEYGLVTPVHRRRPGDRAAAAGGVVRALAAAALAVIAVAGCGSDNDGGGPRRVDDDRAAAEATETKRGLDSALEKYREGDRSAASDRLESARRDHFDLVEPALREDDAVLASALHLAMYEQLPQAIDEGVTVSALAERLVDVEVDLDSAVVKLRAP